MSISTSVSLVSATIRKQAEYKIRRCHSAHGIRYIIVNRRGCLQVASSFGRKTWRLSDDMVPRRDQGPRDGRKAMMTGTGTGAGMGTMTSTGIKMGKRVGMGMGARTGVGTGTIVETMAEEGDSLGTCEMVIEVG